MSALGGATVNGLRCVDCRRPVHPTRGGAYCEVHTPEDRTGGVAPHDALFSARTNRGDAPRVRLRHGEGPERLRAAGWVCLGRVGASRPRWRSPAGAEYLQEYAVYLITRRAAT